MPAVDFVGGAIGLHEHQELARGQAMLAHALEQGVLIIVAERGQRIGKRRPHLA